MPKQIETYVSCCTGKLTENPPDKYISDLDKTLVVFLLCLFAEEQFTFLYGNMNIAADIIDMLN